jgi:RNA polymerase sigma-70 factor (ECF subfamily)
MSTVPSAIELPWQELRVQLRAFIARRVRHHADVDDLVQRVLLQIVTGLGALRDAERLHAWVYRVARNAIVDYYRSAPVRREVPSGDSGDLMTAAETNGPAVVEDERTALRELATCLAPMIRQLPSAYQDAITMTDLEGLTQADAAKRAGISASGMKSRVQRARHQLRAIVDACCRVELDRRGAIVAYTPRRPKACSCSDSES